MASAGIMGSWLSEYVVTSAIALIVTDNLTTN